MLARSLTRLASRHAAAMTQRAALSARAALPGTGDCNDCECATSVAAVPECDSCSCKGAAALAPKALLGKLGMNYARRGFSSVAAVADCNECDVRFHPSPIPPALFCAIGSSSHPGHVGLSPL